jgi:predicted Zn-dependent protease
MIAQTLIVLALLASSLAIPLLAERTKLKPDFNIFTIAQDIELGLKISQDIESQTEILSNSAATRYLDALGKRLAAKAPGGEQYRFVFKIVNDKSINAFGLPGGFVYVNRGTVEAAATEAELATVIAHEIAHIVLRHGTHRISKAYGLQVPVSALGPIGRNSIAAVLAQIGGGFTASSILLKNPLEAERQADLMGIQIIYDARYHPEAAARFFERLANEKKGTTTSLSEHPDPLDRIGNVTKEIERLGGVPSNAILDSPEYQNVRRLVSSSSELQFAPTPR